MVLATLIAEGTHSMGTNKVINILIIVILVLLVVFLISRIA